MKKRADNLEKLDTETFDVLIIGGGINGAASAASLAAKGAKVALIDRHDFASSTSSNSSNLAWGGIKYLETHEFRLVNKLCKSRNHLMRSYPSTVKEIRFLTTIQKGFRFHTIIVYLGALLYWVMGRFKTRAPKILSTKAIARKEVAINTSETVGGIEYSDCYLYDNDARFVFNFIKRAINEGCIAVNYVESLAAYRKDNTWTTVARDNRTGKTFDIQSKVVINACGPWVDHHNAISGQTTQHRHLLSKGIHLIVDKLTIEERVLAFFASDGRLFFVIPMGPKTCIGTTDDRVDSAEIGVTEEDRQFILNNANSLLKLDRPLCREDIIAERCGVRPLALEGKNISGDWLNLSRKHAIDVNEKDQHLSIFGGKLTDCINIGEEVAGIVAQLGVSLPHSDKHWYGEDSQAQKKAFMQKAAEIQLDKLTDPSSSEPLSQRLWRRYGEQAMSLLEDISKDQTLAELLIAKAEYIRCELNIAAREEMIVCLDDFLRRRTKISMLIPREELIRSPGLRYACEHLFGDEAAAKLQEYININTEQKETP